MWNRRLTERNLSAPFDMYEVVGGGKVIGLGSKATFHIPTKSHQPGESFVAFSPSYY